MKSRRSPLAPARLRRQYQRDFMRWLSENKDRFAVEPLKPTAKVNFVELRFPDLSSAISIAIRANSIVVVVTWRNQFFDLLLDLEIGPVWNGQAYRCELCDESEMTFPDLATMRSDHLYQPFLEWCNEQLFTSQWLEMVTGGRSTGASLLREIDDRNGNAMVNLFLGLKRLDGQPMCRENDIDSFRLPLFGRDQ
jgi:hypothetical protein